MNKTERYRIAKALNAAADALEGKKVKARATPRVFVGLVQAPALGEWVDVDFSLEDEIERVVAEAKAKLPGAEEWMISDYEDMPDLGSNPSIDDLVKMGELVEEHDEVAVNAAWALTDDVDESERLLRDGYGVYDSEEDYAYQYVDNMGGPDELGAETLSQYIDYKKLARDLMYENTLVRVGGVPYVFHD